MDNKDVAKEWFRTDYAVNVRYPFPMDINEADMHLALKSAHKIRDFVSEKVEIVE